MSWLATSGRLELFLGTMLLVVHLAVGLPMSVSWGDLATGAALCVAGAVAGRWPIPSAIFIGVVLSTLFVLPRNWAVPGLYAYFLPLLSLSSSGRIKLQWGFSAWYFLALVALTLRDVPTEVSPAPYVLLWLFLVVVPGLVGGSLDLATRFRELELAEEQRVRTSQLARDLHDTVAHDLSLIVMRVNERNPVMSELDSSFIRDAARRSLTHLREMVQNLRDGGTPPAQLPPMRFGEALDTSAVRLKEHGYQPNVTVNADLSELSAEVDGCLSWVTQEATANMIRHGDPRAAEVDGCLSWVTQEATANMIRHGDPRASCQLIIDASDDLVEALFVNKAACPPHAAQRGVGLGGLGLIGLRERAERVGGTVTIESERGNRWTLLVSIPTV